ncbi:MAG: hypothetical protein NTV80_26505 [Verrucomicrobia bacterium]|nr:hypothetical protein [Verrucomicrobiota bacterium]
MSTTATPRCSTGPTNYLNPIGTKGKKADPNAAALLYDVSKDPAETTDLAAQEPERVTMMTAALETWKTSVEKSLSGADYGSHSADILPVKKKKKKQP